MFEKQQSTPNFTLFPIPSHNPLLSCSFDIPQPIILPPGTDPYALSNLDRHAKGRLDPLPALEVDPSAASRSEIITKMADLTPSEHAGRAFCETTTVSTPSHPLGNSGALTQHAVTDVIVIATRSKNTKSIQCDVCNITCNSEDVLTRHKEGKKHLKNLQKLSLSSAATKQTSPSVANASLDGDSYEKKHVLLSNISDVGCNSEDMFTEPLEGNRHVAQVASGGLCGDSLSNPTSVSAAPAQPSNCGTDKARDRANISKSVWCEVCNVGCTSDTVLSRHILGKKHLKNVKNLEQIVSQPSSPIASMATTVAKPVEDPRLRDGEIVNSEGGKPTWCEVCKASCSSNVLSRHISGKKHLKNLQNLEEVPVVPATPVASVTTPPAGHVEATKGEIVNSKEGKSAWCELCRIGCNTYDMLNKHVSGKKHQKNMKKSEYLTGPCTAVVAEPSVTGPLQDSVNEGEVVTLESCKRKAKKSVASHEDLDTKRQKMIEGGAASGSLISCTLCNVVCNSPRAFTSHLAGQKHAAMALKQVKAGSNGQNV